MKQTKQLEIISNDLSIKFNVKYESMATSEREKPTVVAISNGKVVNLRSIYKNQVVKPGETTKRWVDEQDNVINTEPEFHIDSKDGEVIEKVSQTKSFNIQSFDELRNYTDEFIIEKYYELYPSDNGHKKDVDRQVASNNNAYYMRMLWEFLTENNKVAMGEFNPSTAGFITSYGYIRAISFQNKWGLEIGTFKERKVFKYLQESVPQKQDIVQTKSKKVSLI